MKYLVLLLALSPTAFASDVISCETTAFDGQRIHLRVTETAHGYETAAGVVGGAERGGPVDRDIVDGRPARAFHGADVSVYHLFSYLLFRDQAGVLEFPESDCVPTPQGPGVVVGHGELGEGAFGDCSSDDGVGYLYLAKQHAYSDAANQCPGRKAHLLGNFRLSVACRDGSKTAVEEGIFRCDE